MYPAEVLQPFLTYILYWLFLIHITTRHWYYYLEQKRSKGTPPHNQYELHQSTSTWKSARSRPTEKCYRYIAWKCTCYLSYLQWSKAFQYVFLARLAPQPTCASELRDPYALLLALIRNITIKYQTYHFICLSSVITNHHHQNSQEKMRNKFDSGDLY